MERTFQRRRLMSVIEVKRTRQKSGAIDAATFVKADSRTARCSTRALHRLSPLCFGRA